MERHRCDDASVAREVVRAEALLYVPHLDLRNLLGEDRTLCY
jgi:hypothetical protein